MAYDGYYDQYQPGNTNPNPNEHGYPQAQYPYYEPDHLSMPQPQMPTGSPANTTPEPYNYSEPYNYPEPQRHQPSQPSTGHINDAVNSAVNSSGSGYLSPEVLSQITATVIQQLKTTGLDNGLQGSGAPPPRSQSQQPWQTDSRPHTESPPIAPPRSNSIPPPSSLPGNIENYQPFVSDEIRPSPRPTPPPVERRASVSSQDSARSHMVRPRPPDRDVTVVEMTTLEKIWGTLFEDDKRTPTKKCGQFLRGIAVHLIEDYEPKNSIVILPEKMQQFYRDTHDPDDPYPWHDIFDDRTSSISRLFREAKVQHHLVQKNGDLTERPDVPGLTPKGFEQWATIMILSNPNREYERLAKAVLNMPISNPDDKKERFPKELPRRLFPDVPDFDLRERIEDHIVKHCGVDLPYITAEERAEATHPRTGRSSTTNSSPPQRAQSYERGRPSRTSPGSTARDPTPAVIDDEDIPIAPGPIERERKPYSAAPGRGKTYDEGSNSAKSSFSTSRPSVSTSEATPKPQRSEYDRDSLYARDRYARGSRSSSRSVHRDGYRHSESDLPRDREPRYAGVSSQDLPYMESPISADDEPRRYHHHRGGSRGGADEDYYRSGVLGGHGISHGYDKHYAGDRFSRG